jgi:hypothetical protein
MRQLKHISYSGFTLFESDPETFYRRYLADNRGPREPQNHYMAVGSAFDAFVKADLHKRFVNDGDPKYTREALFESQVEPHNRDRALKDGEDVFQWYKKVGAYADLCEDMRGCVDPRFEAELTGEVTVSWMDGSILLLGKPDVMFVTRTGARVVHDFKVQGYYSKAPKSPSPGYICLFPTREIHKNAVVVKHKGHNINGNAPLHIHCTDWAEQLSMYAWVLGEHVGSDYILSIDQICCNSRDKNIRVAKHSAICTDPWQRKLFQRLHRCWYACKNGHVFLDMPYEDNLARIKVIEAELASNPDETFRSFTNAPPRIR